jgi:hypothetical protein
MWTSGLNKLERVNAVAQAKVVPIIPTNGYTSFGTFMFLLFFGIMSLD